MTVPDAQPVQFWPEYCDTFNEQEVGGMKDVCWCQPWNASDEINMQITDTADISYQLRVVGESGETIVEEAMNESPISGSEESTYSYSFMPDDYDLSNQKIVFEIHNSDLSGETLVLKSDCQDIKDFHNVTKLIEYRNHRNFAGLIYANVSPENTFYLRVPCKFFHERYPEEDEAMELTSSVITTSAQMKEQKLLQVQFAPYYFHKKVQQVLKHQTVIIDSNRWKKEENYELAPGRNDWQLKTAQCYLTRGASIVRNVI
jgi:hypothetical protein